MSWPPRTVAALEALVSSVNVHETASLEVKRELPATKGKNVDIAIDVCAMTVDGGIIVYGVDEVSDGLELKPIDLAGTRERIADVVRSSVAEPPAIEIIELLTGPDEGYLVVNVAESDRAPHMVQVKGVHRYYGRDAGGNRLLTEGEVARLYARRGETAPTQQALSDRLRQSAPRPPTAGTFGTLHLLVRPSSQHADFLDRAWGRVDAEKAASQLFRLAQSAVRDVPFAEPWSPNLTSAAGGTLLRNMDEWLFRNGETSGYGTDLAVTDTGDFRVWIERGAADLRSDGRTFTLRDGAIAQIVTHGLVFAARLLESGNYFGSVDAAVVIDGIEGAITALFHNGGMYLIPGEQTPELPSTYARSTRSMVAALIEDPKAVAQKLVGPLLDTARQGGPNVFA